MRHSVLWALAFLIAFAAGGSVLAEETMGPEPSLAPFPILKVDQNPRELNFIGYYFMKGTASNIAPTNEFLKGQVVGRLFGGNTTFTSKEEHLRRAALHPHVHLLAAAVRRLGQDPRQLRTGLDLG